MTLSTTERIPYVKNPITPQDMIEHAFDRFQRTGDIIPVAQDFIYQNIARATGHKSLLEAGCGIGVGTNILRGRPFLYKDAEAVQRIVVGTDCDPRHLAFAHQLYPFGAFDRWDVTAGPYPAKLYDYVVAVEVLEHVADPAEALKNMALSCREGVWLSTPNRYNQGLNPLGPPFNKHHVQEFIPSEVVGLGAPFFSTVEVFDQHLNPVGQMGTQLTPLVYHFVL